MLMLGFRMRVRGFENQKKAKELGAVRTSEHLKYTFCFHLGSAAAMLSWPAGNLHTVICPLLACPFRNI
jgi:hypothetical protein